MKVISLLVVFLVASLQGGECQVGNAGAKVVLSKQGLDYAAWHAVEIIDKKVREAHIDDLRGNADITIGNVDYEIANTKITEFTKPSETVVVNPGHGLTLSLNGAGVSAEGDWRYKFEKAFIKFGDSGSFVASANGISISVSVSLQNDNGIPKITTTGCDCSIDDVHFNLSGGASWLYNIFIKFFKNKIRSSFEDIFCDEAQNAINNNGATLLASLNMQAKLNDLLTLSYALAADPIFQDNYMESNHAARFLGDDVVENAPPLQASLDHMLSTSISDVTLNSGMRVLYNQGRLQHSEDITDNVIVGLVSGLLEEAGIKHDAIGFGITVTASVPPRYNIQPGSLSINAEGEAKVEIINLDGSRINAFTVKIKLGLQVEASIEGDKLKGSVLDGKIGIETSGLSNVHNEKVTEAINQLVELIRPSLNHGLGQGIPLPTLEGIYFKDSVIHLNDRHVTVSSNIEYRGF